MLKPRKRASRINYLVPKYGFGIAFLRIAFANLLVADPPFCAGFSIVRLTPIALK